MLCRTIANAQTNPAYVNAPPFVDLEASKIQLLGDQNVWNNWHEKLDRLVFDGIGKINIVHVGGSHIQADMWSMQVRHRLQHLVPGVRGGRGFIFPYNMAKSNNPYWYFPEFIGNWTAVKNTQADATESLGLAGYAVTTSDSMATLKIGFRGDVYAGYAFNRVKVLHRQDSSFTVDAFTFDSTLTITKEIHPELGYTEFIYNGETDTLWLRFHRETMDQLRFTLHGIVLENDDPGFIYHAVGVNGASTTSWLRCERFTSELELLKPDLVILSIGINDAHDSNFSEDAYKRNYLELIRRIRSASPGAAILLTTNTDSFNARKTPNRNASAVRKVMLELSTEQGVAVWDTWGVMGGEASIRTWEAAGLAKKDRVHFHRPGYALLGDLLFTALMQDHGEHVQRRFGH
jgi:hypothetical protein